MTATKKAHRITLCGEKIDRPGHVCAFFDSRTEKYDTLAAYFAEGLAEGERIINVVDGDARSEHMHQVKARNVPLEDAIAGDDFTLLTSEETYLKDGAMDLEGMMDLLRDALETARTEGRRVRTCGDMTWVSRTRVPMQRVMEYEARVNELVPTFDCTLLCVYDLADVTTTLMSDILATHPFAILNGRARANPYYIPPAEYLEMLRTPGFGANSGSSLMDEVA